MQTFHRAAWQKDVVRLDHITLLVLAKLHCSQASRPERSPAGSGHPQPQRVGSVATCRNQVAKESSSFHSKAPPAWKLHWTAAQKKRCKEGAKIKARLHTTLKISQKKLSSCHPASDTKVLQNCRKLLQQFIQRRSAFNHGSPEGERANSTVCTTVCIIWPNHLSCRDRHETLQIEWGRARARPQIKRLWQKSC